MDKAELKRRVQAYGRSPEERYGAQERDDGPWQSEGALGDTAVGLAAGTLDIPGVVTGLADTAMALNPAAVAARFGDDEGLSGFVQRATNRPFSRAAEAVGEATGFQPGEWADTLREERYSPQMQTQQAEVDQEWGDVGSAVEAGDWGQAFGEGVEATASMLRNPRTIQSLVTESLPQMVLGGAIGRGVSAASGATTSLAGRPIQGALTPLAGAGQASGRAVATGQAAQRMAGVTAAQTVARQTPRIGAVGGAAIGEGAVIAGGTMDSIDDEVDPQRAALAALGAGAGGAAIGYAGGRLAQRMGLVDPDVALAGGGFRAGADAPRRGVARRVAGGSLAEGFLQEMPQESLETMSQNWAEGEPLLKGVPRAAISGMLAGNVMGGVANIAPPRRAQQPTNLMQTPAGGEQTGLPPEGPRGPMNPQGQDLQTLKRYYRRLRRVAQDAVDHPDLQEEATQRMSGVMSALEQMGYPREVVDLELAKDRYSEAQLERDQMQRKYQEALRMTPERAPRYLQRVRERNAELAQLEEAYGPEELQSPDVATIQALQQDPDAQGYFRQRRGENTNRLKKSAQQRLTSLRDMNDEELAYEIARDEFNAQTNPDSPELKWRALRRAVSRERNLDDSLVRQVYNAEFTEEGQQAERERRQAEFFSEDGGITRAGTAPEGDAAAPPYTRMADLAADVAQGEATDPAVTAEPEVQPQAPALTPRQQRALQAAVSVNEGGQDAFSAMLEALGEQEAGITGSTVAQRAAEMYAQLREQRTGTRPQNPRQSLEDAVRGLNRQLRQRYGDDMPQFTATTLAQSLAAQSEGIASPDSDLVGAETSTEQSSVSTDDAFNTGYGDTRMSGAAAIFPGGGYGTVSSVGGSQVSQQERAETKKGVKKEVNAALNTAIGKGVELEDARVRAQAWLDEYAANEGMNTDEVDAAVQQIATATNKLELRRALMPVRDRAVEVLTDRAVGVMPSRPQYDQVSAQREQERQQQLADIAEAAEGRRQQVTEYVQAMLDSEFAASAGKAWDKRVARLPEQYRVPWDELVDTQPVVAANWVSSAWEYINNNPQARWKDGLTRLFDNEYAQEMEVTYDPNRQIAGPRSTGGQAALTDDTGAGGQPGQETQQVSGEPEQAAPAASETDGAETGQSGPVTVEAQAEPETSGDPTVGAEATTYLPDNTPIQTRWRVVEYDDLVVSNRLDLTENPDFPPELQPRARGDNVNLSQQVQNIVARFNPERLGASPEAGAGSPIIGPDNVAETGNGRLVAIGRVYRANGRSAGEYRQFVAQQAAANGISPDVVSQMSQPVLVRERTSTVDRARFVRQANDSNTAGMSAYELAISDSSMLSPEDLRAWAPSKDGTILAASNRPFIRMFLQNIVGASGAAQYTDRDGNPTQELAQRMQRAVFARAYRDGDNQPAQDLVELVTEDTDQAKNLARALESAAANLAEARESGSQLAQDVVDTIISAVRLVRQSRRDGVAIEELVNQSDAFAEEIAAPVRDLALGISSNMRSRAALERAFGYIGQAALQESGSQGDNMFGDTITEGDIINEGVNQAQPEGRRRAEPAGGSVQQSELGDASQGQDDLAQGAAPAEQTQGPVVRTRGRRGRRQGEQQLQPGRAATAEDVQQAIDNATENPGPEASERIAVVISQASESRRQAAMGGPTAVQQSEIIDEFLLLQGTEQANLESVLDFVDRIIGPDHPLSELAQVLRTHPSLQNLRFMSEPAVERANALGTYYHQLHAININPELWSSISAELMFGGRKGSERQDLQLAETILHELVHGATVRAINMEAENNSEVFARIRQVFIQTRQYLRDNPDEFSDSERGAIRYMFSDMYEFMTMAMTSPEAQRILKAVPASDSYNGNMFGRFVQAVLDFFGLTNTSPTALEEALSIVNDIMELDGATTRKFINNTMANNTLMVSDMSAPFDNIRFLEQINFEGVDAFTEEVVRRMEAVDDAEMSGDAEAKATALEGLRRVAAAIEKTVSDIKQEMRWGANGSYRITASDNVAPDTLSDRIYDSALNRAPSQLKNMLADLKNRIKGLTYLSSFSHDFVDMVRKYLPQAETYFTTIFNRLSERNEMHVEIQRIVDPVGTLNNKQRDALNTVLREMTYQEAWAFQPDWVPQQVTVDPALARKFEALPEAAQKAAINMFRYAQQSNAAIQQQLRNDIITTYDAYIEKAKSNREEDKRIEEKARALREHDDRQLDPSVPYLPLKRWGEWAVVHKSERFRQAEEAGNRATINQLKQDPSHYQVVFAESEYAARQERDRMEQELGVTIEDPFQRMRYDQSNEVIPFDLMTRLREEAIGRTDGREMSEVDRRVAAAVDRMYIAALEESSVRKSELRRLKVEGAGRDMVRAFIEHGQGLAALSSALKINKETRRVIQQMKQHATDPKAGRQRNDRMMALNEVLARHAVSLEMDTRDNWQQRVMGYTSIWMLLTSPAYFIQNSTQPFMLTYPVLSAKFGANKSMGFMRKAYSTVMAARRDTKADGTEGLMDPAKLTDPREQMLFTRLQRLGLLDVGIAADLGTLRQGRGPIGKGFYAVHHKMLTAVRWVEVYNRGVTAIASFRLERQRLMAARESGNNQLSDSAIDEAAMKYATHIVQTTQGDYSGPNAPRLIDKLPAGRLLTQFRKFQLIQIGLLTRTFHQAFKNADAGERAIGRRQLTYILGMHAMVGGALGLPAANIIGYAVAKAFGDDDEPADAELLARRLIGDKEVADLILRGLPASLGVDASTRLGMGLTFSLMPFADISASRDGFYVMLGNLLGPTVGLGAMFVDGAGQIAQGNVAMGMTQFMPAGVKNAMKAYLYKTDGVRRRNGDLALSAEELSWFSTVTQGLGWPGTQITDRYFATGAVIKVDEHFRSRTSKIKRAYTEAYRAGDREGMREARQAWMDLQAMRREYGFGNPQPVSQLIRAPREQQEREGLMIEGVAARRTQQRFVESLFE